MRMEVKGTGQMKELLLKWVMFASVLMLCLINHCNNAVAENKNDEVEVTILTDKEEYKADEVIKGKITIVNNSEKVVNNISYVQDDLPGYDITMKSSTSENNILKSGESVIYEITFNPDKVTDIVENEEVALESEKEPDENSKDDNDKVNSDINDDEEHTDYGEEKESVDKEMDEVPQTDSDTNYDMIIIMGCSGIVLLVFVAKKIKLKYDRRYIAYMLILGITGGLFQPVGSLKAKADTRNTENSYISSEEEQIEKSEIKNIEVYID